MHAYFAYVLCLLAVLTCCFTLDSRCHFRSEYSDRESGFPEATSLLASLPCRLAPLHPCPFACLPLDSPLAPLHPCPLLGLGQCWKSEHTKKPRILNLLTILAPLPPCMFAHCLAPLHPCSLACLPLARRFPSISILFRWTFRWTLVVDFRRLPLDFGGSEPSIAVDFRRFP